MDEIKAKAKADSALRRAVMLNEERSAVKYPHNFPFVAMERVRREKERMERRSRVVATVFCATSCVAGVAVLVSLVDFKALWNSLSSMFDAFAMQEVAHEQHDGGGSVVSVIATVVCLTFFVCLDRYLGRRFRRGAK